MDVRIEHLSLRRDGYFALEVPQLELRAGQITALVGPNGAGKTTLLRCIAGLEACSPQAVRIGGETPAAARAQRRLAYAFQQPVFFRGSARYNLELALDLFGVGREGRAARVEVAARQYGVADLLDRSVAQLSVGEAQRLNVARALMLDTPVALLDEPFAGVDEASRGLLRACLRAAISPARTIVFVTHDAPDAEALAQRVVAMERGRIVG